MGYTISTTLARPYDDTVTLVRDALAEQGFGVLTEIDLRATLLAKLDVEVAPQLILGACRPPLAHQAIAIDPSVATLLPCNVVVRAGKGWYSHVPDDADSTVVEAFDPATMAEIGGEAFAAVAADARERLVAALDSLSATRSGV